MACWVVAFLLASVPSTAALGCARQQPDLASTTRQLIGRADDREAIAQFTPKTIEAGRLEVYGWSLWAVEEQYRNFDWDVLTAVGWKTDAALRQLAAAKGVRVEAASGAALGWLLDWPSRRHEWVAEQVANAKRLGLGGINFDLEDPIPLGTRERGGYTHLVAETARAFHSAIPGSKVTVDVPWSPYDVDGRNYDWTGLAEAADVLIIMAYDIQSQIWGRCVASANSPLAAVQRGVHQWLELGVPAHKLMLGLPWYGYDYLCVPGADGAPVAADTDACFLQPAQFAGAPCSDAAGSQRPYLDIMGNVLGKQLNSTPVRWDEVQQSNYVNYVDDDGQVHQVWFDDPRSLSLRYAVAREARLRGIAIWNLDYLDYTSDNATSMRQTHEMWQALADAAAPPGIGASIDGGKAGMRQVPVQGVAAGGAGVAAVSS